ncbi:MgtC/SapB family protein [Candidatus Bipolaricaulota bacterium]|nr:MgtC/SapB family protein [Candidatus Bipolaricaulota bacterium]
MGTVDALVRIVVAALLGGAIGFERELRGRAAGLRTHILVCVGAALVMILAGELGQADGPGRALAGIVTGVGFLGAGAIIRTRDIVRGVTTAACVWLVAALGAVVGQGLYVLAAGAGVLAVLVLFLLNRVGRLIPAHTYHTVVVHGAGTEAARLEARCRAQFASARHRVLGVEVRLDRGEGETSLTFYTRTSGEACTARLAEELLALSEVRAVSCG